MPKALCKSQTPQYHSLFPDWTGPRPFRFFLLENLLEARQQSTFPTNGAGPDEDANMYLASLLTGFLRGKHPENVIQGISPMLHPPAKDATRRQRADYYRNNADFRLIMLGLFDRGDASDLVVGKHCYQMAVNLLDKRKMVSQGTIDVWRKLAENFDLYVQVLSTMAVGRLGLGASLSPSDLNYLAEAPKPEINDPDPRQEMDDLLDLLLEMREPGGQEKRAEVIDLALRLNLNPEKLLRQAG
jgi:hypothetical protein